MIITKLKLNTLIVGISALLSSPTIANIVLADAAFEAKNYQSAITQYKAAAQTGNARAMHTLGVIYNQGVGVTQDKIKATSWLALAAQYHYKNAKQVANALLKTLSPTQKQKLLAQIQLLEPQYGQQAIEQLALPLIITDKLNSKVEFSNEGNLYLLDNEDDFIDDLLNDTDLNDTVFEDTDEDSFNQTSVNRSSTRPYFLIADLLIAADGTVRHIDVIQQYGAVSHAISKLYDTQYAKPIFNGKNIPFYQRVRLGLAQQVLSTMDLRADYPYIYRGIRSIVNKQSEQNLTASDKYLYALVLMSFEGISRQPNQVEQLLTQAAQADLPQAQYVLGSKLYREQTDIKQAIFWLTKAAQNGLANAEYFMGELFLTSPWVKKDERKAHFWLDRAAKQGQILGLQRSAYLKLHAQDQRLRDAKTALTYLKALAKTDKNNPDILYLLSVAYEQQQKRQRALAVKTIRNAIFRAQQRGWDTQDWQDKLAAWTTGGNVTISDETY